MKEMKRILSLVLCFVMLVGLMPTIALKADAAETVIDAAIFCSDVHNNPSTVTSIFNGIKSADPTFDPTTAAFVGDTQTTASTVTAAAQEVYSDVQCIYAFGNHDDENGNTSIPDFTGLSYGDSTTNYYIYTISETSMASSSPDTSGFTSTVAGLDKTKPLFIISHLPLHSRRGDSNGAAVWYPAISAAAEEMDIFFFWAHNHTSEGSADTAAYYVAKNGTETITLENTTTVVTPNFTYANAGYINPPNNPARNNVATAVRIYEDSVNLTVYNASGELTGTYAVNETVTREFAAEEVTLSSIAISGKTEYYVGDELALTVTATYSDGTTANVTADATLSGYDMSTAGTQTVTATYGEKTATVDITVTAVQINSIAVTTQPTKLTYVIGEELDTTGMVVSATYNNGTTAEVTGWYTSAVDMTTAGEKTVTVNYAVDNITYKTTFTITVEEGLAEGVTLTKIEITDDLDKKEYLISESLEVGGMAVTATFSDGSTREIEYKPFSTSTVYGGYELDNFSMYVEKAHEVKVTYTFGEVTCTATTTINVWNEDFTDETTGVKVHVTGDYGVTAASVADSTNTYVASAVSGVISGTNYVAYDISLTFDEGYATTNATKTVTLPIPEGISNPVVYYVSNDGETVTNMNAVKDGNGNVTFETTHFSTYVIGESTEITVPENQTATGSGTTTTTTKKTVYVLSSSISSGNDYLIVNGNAAGSYYALANNSGSVAATGVTIKSGDVDGDGDTETYIELDDATDELWTASGSSSTTLQNGSYYLYYNSGLGLSTRSSTTWSYSSNRLSYRSGRTTYYLRYNSGWTTTSSSSSASSIYFYVPTEVEVETTTTVSGTYSIEGEDVTQVVSENLEIFLESNLTFTPADGSAATTSDPENVIYTIYSDPGIITSLSEDGVLVFNGNYGTAVIKVTSQVTFGEETKTVTDYFTVEAKAPYYGIQLHQKTEDGELVLIEAPVALKGIKANDTYSVWAVVKEYDGEIAEDDEMDAGEDGHDIGELGNALSWSVSDESIATIDAATGVITFTGTNYGTFQVTVAYKGADGKTITDTITISATESLYVVPGDGTNDFPEYPNEGAVRFDKTATAVGNFSETGIALVELSMTGVPYSTGNELDVVLMLDMTGSMDDVSDSSSEPTGYVRVDASIAASKAFIASIVKNEDGSYNKNRIGVYVFNKDGASTLLDFGTIDNDDEFYALVGKVGASGEEYGSDYTSGTLDTVWTDFGVSGGTPYDDGLAECQEVLSANKTEGRQQFAVFMTDGVPTSYAYVNGTTYGTHSSASAVAGMLTSASNYATRDTDYKYEYYSTEMKKAGVTVYSVGVGLFNENNAWSGSATQCGNLASALLNDISGPANEASQPDAVGTATLSKKDSYFFSVDDADAGTEMTKVFSNIAQKILEAATNVEVEDKIGNNYSINFSIPGYGTDNAVSADALDGTTEFYIQVVEYQLNADKERTGDPAVLENFTFNADGTLKSHTVNGVACSGCTHVTTTNGVITAISGTYFDYKSDSTGEYLTWESEKVSTTELALQYFAHLDNSTGVDTADQIAAGTYYTNEYATLTYDNYQGNRVQQEFPIPQMTWNGAQVHYVFYLVNENGQPVNTAGRVVPFAEAVYVTDVYHYEVIWNDLEQTTGLSASYLAEKLVPEVYELYDDDASYELHVYEDENAVNLNNHFIIGGDVTDEYNPSWTNAKTTYVFNTKADDTKYNVVGTYIANDGNDNSTSTSYLCKSAGIEGATYTTTTDVGGSTVYTVTSVGDGYQTVAGETQVPASEMESTTGGTIIDGYVYYVDENGVVYTIVRKSNGTEVRTGFDFSNTTVAFAVVWKPQLKPDTVVVDYGLDVLIDVTTNDTMAAGVVGVRTTAPNAETDGTYKRDEANTLTSVDVELNGQKIGTATVESLKNIRFSLDKTNGMQFNEPVSFFYESDVNFYNSNNTLVTTSMYSSVTVIPATTIYYEDEYVTLTTHTLQSDGTYKVDKGWTTKSTSASATQAQDRPGESKISETLDADNNYGYDEAYSSMSTYSMDNAAMITVSAGVEGQATFDFYGTGFDVISMTDTTTGTIVVQVYAYDEQGKLATDFTKSYVVDTYYGYKLNENGEWVTTTENDPNALYQVPVMKVSGLTYGQYHAKIVVFYDEFFDNVCDDSSYDFYLDAIRIYDPTGNQNETANNAYKADGEGWPTYQEVRDYVIEQSTYDEMGEGEVEGVVFIDGVGNTSAVADYASFGPNNELYLAPGQAIAFDLNATAVEGTSVAKVQLALKTVSGTASVKVYAVNGKTVLDADLSTATDMYYDITALNGKTVVIMNDGSSGVLSITNVKVTYTEAQTATAPAMFMLRRSSVDAALATLNVEEEVPETTVPEETVPETTVPETTAPEETEPETTVPETTVPEETEPETTVPETTVPEETEPSVEEQVEEVVREVVKVIKKIFGWIFG